MGNVDTKDEIQIFQTTQKINVVEIKAITPEKQASPQKKTEPRYKSPFTKSNDKLKGQIKSVQQSVERPLDTMQKIPPSDRKQVTSDFKMQSVTVQIEDSNEKSEFGNSLKFKSTPKSIKQTPTNKFNGNKRAILSTVKEDSQITMETVTTTIQKFQHMNSTQGKNHSPEARELDLQQPIHETQIEH